MIKPTKCIQCGKKPSVLNLGGVAYVQCPCGKWNPYEFCGARVVYAIEQWNVANAHVPGKRPASRRCRKCM